MLTFLQAYNHLILQTLLSLTLTLILIFLKIPIFFLQGLHTYVHPKNVTGSDGARAAIRRPDSGLNPQVDGYQNLSSRTNGELKKRNKYKDNKFEFDENNAQIFRLKLDEGHLQTRLFFNKYRNSFFFSFLGISSFCLSKYLGESKDSGVFSNGNLIPVIFGFIGLIKAFTGLAKISFEKSASKISEKQFSTIFGVVGFFIGVVVLSGIGPTIFDFEFDSIEGSWRVFLVVLMGFLAGFLYMPAGKNARSFWLGTDQIRCSLSIISCGWFARMILYANYMLNLFTALLWINPLAELLVKNTSCKGGNAENLVRNLGFSKSDFIKLRTFCLLFSGVLQIVACTTEPTNVFE